MPYDYSYHGMGSAAEGVARGEEAYRAGMRWSDNPHPAGTPDHEAWKEGWGNAHNAAGRASRDPDEFHKRR